MSLVCRQRPTRNADPFSGCLCKRKKGARLGVRTLEKRSEVNLHPNEEKGKREPHHR